MEPPNPASSERKPVPSKRSLRESCILPNLCIWTSRYSDRYHSGRKTRRCRWTSRFVFDIRLSEKTNIPILGTCFVGNQSDKGLLLLVAIPLLCYWMISCGYLLTGYLRKKSMKNVKIPANIDGLGTFLIIYNVPSGLLLLSMFYQYGVRENWLILLDSSMHGTQKAPLWLYVAQPFLELLTGVLASSWAIGPRITSLCKSNVKQPNVKPPPPIKYQQSAYTSASYQTICPPNSIVSTSMVSIGTSGRMYKPHVRKHSYGQPVNPSLHGSRRARSYRMSSMRSASLTGHETVL